jgi:hypothetical protein
VTARPAVEDGRSSEAAPAGLVLGLSKDAGLDANVTGSGGDDRPEILPQRPEKIESAPGIEPVSEAEADAGPARDDRSDSETAAPSLILIPRHARLSSAPQQRVGGIPAAAPGAGDRPENLSQSPEKIESAPADSWPDGAGCGAAFVVSPWISPLPVTRRVRLTPDGRMAC